MERGLEYDGEELNLREVLRIAARSEETAFIARAARVFVVRTEAARRGVRVDDKDLQEGVDRFRAARGLLRAADTHAWLDERYLDADNLAERVRDEMLAERLRALVCEKGDVRAWFDSHGDSLDEVDAWRIAHRDEGVVREIALLVREGEPFDALARRYSDDRASAAAGGRLGRVPLDALPESARASARAARPNTLLPVVETDQGWSLYRIDAVFIATLDRVTTALIESRLFEAWLAPRVRAVMPALWKKD